MYHNGLRTFFYLIIANIGIILPVLAIIMMTIWDWSLINNVDPQIWEHIAATEFDGSQNMAKCTHLFVLMSLPVCIFAYVIFQKGLSMRTVLYIFLIAAYFLLRWSTNGLFKLPQETADLRSVIFHRYTIIFIIANIVAIAPTVVAYLNFDEVVSRRMLYRNSSASMFEEQFKYSIAVFFDSATAITLFILSIIWQIYAAPYLLQSSFN